MLTILIKVVGALIIAGLVCLIVMLPELIKYSISPNIDDGNGTTMYSGDIEENPEELDALIDRSVKKRDGLETDHFYAGSIWDPNYWDETKE